MATGRRRGDEDERLFRACEGKEFDRAKQLLKDGADPRKHFDSKCLATIIQKPTQCTSLHAVCLHGSLELAKLLVEWYGCDPEVETTGYYGRIRPLHLASAGGHLDVVRYLVVERGCDAECVDWRTCTPLLWACGARSEYTPRDMKASEERALDVVKFLTTSANCDPNKRDYIDYNALLWSCDSRLTSVTRFLVSELHCTAAVHSYIGNTPVHLASQNNALETLKFLICEERCDPNVKNNNGYTPLQVAFDPATIRELIKNGASTAHIYKDCGHILGHSSKKPLPNTVKMLIVGDPSSGKSTLTESLKDESILNRIVNIKISGVNEKTAGVVPHQIKSKKLGHVSLLDFAGQREFYNSHGALLQNAIQSSTPIFVIVVNLSKSDKEITDNIRYWLSFIENHSSSKPHVIITGSHIDLLKSKGDDPDIKTKRISSSLQQSSQSSSFTLAGFVAMDCRYPDSRGMRELRQLLQKSCDELRLVEESSFASHFTLVHLLDGFRESTACTVKQANAALGIREEVLVKACEELNEKGHILFLKNRAAPEKSWIILNQAVLLSEVSGTIFAPEGFKEHCKLASSTGVVPLSKIREKFPKYSPEMLIGFLSHLEYCHEISDDETTQLLSEATPTAASENEATSSPQQELYFFFPGLVTLDAPAKVWEPQAQFVHHCGWVLQCSRPEHFFVPRFFCVLLLRLAFSFALAPQAVELTSDHPALERKCTVWTSGLFWANNEGVRTLVELRDQSKTMVVAMRCRQDNITKCLQLRSQVIQKVLAALREFCPRLNTSESFIDPSEVTHYPLRPTSQLTLFPLTAIAKSAVAGKSSVVSMTVKSLSLEALLLLEPYADLGEPILRKLFASDTADHKVKQGVLMDMSSRFLVRLPNRRELILKLFPMDPLRLADQMSEAGVKSPEYEILRVLLHWRDGCEGTYQCLREKLDQFSAFAGRNPLQLAEEL